MIQLRSPISQLRTMAIMIDGIEQSLNGGQLLTALYLHSIHGDMRHVDLVEQAIVHRHFVISVIFPDLIVVVMVLIKNLRLLLVLCLRFFYLNRLLLLICIHLSIWG